MWIDGHDLEQDGWYLMEISGWLTAPNVSRGTTALPNVAALLPDTQRTVTARQIMTHWRYYCQALDERDAAVAVLNDATRGLRHLRFDDAPSRVVRAEGMEPQVMPIDGAPAFTVPPIEAIVTFTAYDAASYSVEPSVLALSTSGVEVPVGTLPSVGRIYWGGAWTAGTTRTLTYRDHGGVARATMTFTAPTGQSLASTDYLEIDLSRRYVTKVASAGTRTAADSWYVSGDWIAFDPMHQKRTLSRYGTLEISAGTAQLVYRLAWGL